MGRGLIIETVLDKSVRLATVDRAFQWSIGFLSTSFNWGLSRRRVAPSHWLEKPVLLRSEYSDVNVIWTRHLQMQALKSHSTPIYRYTVERPVDHSFHCETISSSTAAADMRRAWGRKWKFNHKTQSYCWILVLGVVIKGDILHLLMKGFSREQSFTCTDL